MATITSVADPVYANAAQTAVNCTVEIQGQTGTFPFTASASDPDPQGKQIWTNLIAGTYGTIGAYVAPTISAGAQAKATLATALAAGLAITSTSTPALNGTYAIDAAAQNNISGIAGGIASRSRLPGGGTTFNYGDATGALHAFTSANFLDFAAAVEDYCYALYQTAATLAGGGTSTWPTATTTIA